MQKDERGYVWHFSFRLAMSQHQNVGHIMNNTRFQFAAANIISYATMGEIVLFVRIFWNFWNLSKIPKISNENSFQIFGFGNIIFGIPFQNLQKGFFLGGRRQITIGATEK